VYAILVSFLAWARVILGDDASKEAPPIAVRAINFLRDIFNT